MTLTTLRLPIFPARAEIVPILVSMEDTSNKNCRMEYGAAIKHIPMNSSWGYIFMDTFHTAISLVSDAYC